MPYYFSHSYPLPTVLKSISPIPSEEIPYNHLIVTLTLSYSKGRFPNRGRFRVPSLYEPYKFFDVYFSGYTDLVLLLPFLLLRVNFVSSFYSPVLQVWKKVSGTLHWPPIICPTTILYVRDTEETPLTSFFW